jgi:hypothetical protein
MIESVLGRAPLSHRDPDLLGSIGAAHWAHTLQTASSPPAGPTG